MGAHTAPRTCTTGRLVGRSALTVAAALALTGGTASFAFAGVSSNEDTSCDTSCDEHDEVEAEAHDCDDDCSHDSHDSEDVRSEDENCDDDEHHGRDAKWDDDERDRDHHGDEWDRKDEKREFKAYKTGFKDGFEYGYDRGSEDTDGLLDELLGGGGDDLASETPAMAS